MKFRVFILSLLLSLVPLVVFLHYFRIKQSEFEDIDGFELFREQLQREFPEERVFSFEYLGEEDKGYHRKFLFALLPLQLTDQAGSFPKIVLESKNSPSLAPKMSASKPFYEDDRVLIYVYP